LDGDSRRQNLYIYKARENRIEKEENNAIQKRIGTEENNAGEIG
jgi:hypothetical protein